VNVDPLSNDWGVISVENWAEIRRLHRAEGMPIKAIARRLGIGKNTVKRALASDGPPRYERAPKGSAVDEVESRIRELLAEFPDMPATVIAERLGWTRSITVFRARVSELRPLYAPRDPASRTSYAPGELAQCDLWFPPVDIPVGFGQVARLPVLTLASGYARMPGAVMIPTRQAQDLISGHWDVFTGWGAVPRALVWDGESALSSRRGGTVKLGEEFEAFRGMLGVKVVICRPGDPEAKGLVERFNGYLETSFLPGRTFTSPADFNAQLSAWLADVAIQRMHRTLGCRPVDRFEADKAAMLTLPPVMPRLGWTASTRLPRDHYVRIGSNDYSVDPIAIGRRIDVHADLTRVTVRWGDRVVGAHDRHWGRHQTITDPVHREAAARMRLRATRITGPADDEVQVRALSDYDRLLGLDEVVA
jgi:transposase